MFNIAVRQGWLNQNPFGRGEQLVVTRRETVRNRMLTFDEEARLLAACIDARRLHLRPIIICALDTAMRQGEIFRLTWQQIILSGG